MFKKVAFVAVALVVALALVGCSGAAKPEVAKYQDVKDSVAAMVASVDKFNVALDGVKDAASAAAAIEAFTVEYGAVLKAAADVDAKYPELKDGATVPADLKAILDGAAGLGDKVKTAFGKLAPYASEKSVQDAIAKFQDLGK